MVIFGIVLECYYCEKCGIYCKLYDIIFEYENGMEDELVNEIVERLIYFFG